MLRSLIVFLMFVMTSPIFGQSTASTHSGSKALRVWHQTGTYCAARHFAGHFRAGETVTSSAWFTAQTGTSGAILVGNSGGADFGGAGYDNIDGYRVAGNGAWQQVTVSHTMTHEDDMWVYLFADGTSSDAQSVLFDDVVVTGSLQGTIYSEGFESGLGTWLVAGHADLMTASTTSTYNGTKAMRIWQGDWAACRALGQFQTGDVVTATVWFKAPSGTYGQLFLGNATDGTADAYDNASVQQLQGNGGWQQLRLTWTMKAARNMWVYIYGDANTPGETAATNVIYDDVLVTSTARGTVLSEGFENGYVRASAWTDPAGWWSGGHEIVTSITNPDLPVIFSYTASSTAIQAGQSSKLSWDVRCAQPLTVTLNPGGTVAAMATQVVNPTVTAAYTLTATSAAGSVSSSATVTVIPAVTPTSACTLSGTKALRIWRDDWAACRALGQFQTGDVVTATVWFKAPTGTYGQLFLGNATDGTADAYDNASVQQVQGNGGWQQLRLTWTMKAARNMWVYIYGDANTPGETAATNVIYDDVLVTSTTRGTVLSEGFEGGYVRASAWTDPAGWWSGGHEIVTSTTNPDLPVIFSYTASPTALQVGQSSKLSWDVRCAQPLTVTLNPGGAVAAMATQVVNPTATTAYTLTATSAAGSLSQTQMVTVATPVAVTAVTPENPSLIPGGTQAFSATASGGATNSLTWSVDGIPGGNASVGTISASGLYAAPATLPSRTNLCLGSDAFETWSPLVAGTAQAPVVTPNAALAPDGSLTADTVTFNVGSGTTSGDYTFLLANLSSVVVGNPYTASIWIKGASGQQVVLRGVAETAYTLVTCTGKWERISTTETAFAPAGRFAVGLRQGMVGTLNATATVQLWRAQVEAGSAATPGILTTSAPVSATGAVHIVTASSVDDPSKTASTGLTVVTASPVTVSPVTPSNPSLIAGGTQAFSAAASGGATNGLIWSVDGILGGNASVGTISASGLYAAPAASPSRTNLCAGSDAFESWGVVGAGSGSAPVVTPNNAVAPDGTLTADTVVFNTGSSATLSDYSLLCNVLAPTTAGSTYTESVWIKGAPGQQVMLRGVGWSAFTLVTCTGKWERISKAETAVVSDTNRQFQIGLMQGVFGSVNATATVQLWRAQVELGSVATPGILTTSSPVTAVDAVHIVMAASTDDLSKASSTSLTVAASLPPTITAQPVSVVANPGQAVSFSVAATGTGPLSYQWRRNGTNISGATAATFTLASVSAADADANGYCVVVTNSVGIAISSAATLSVIDTQAPVVTVSETGSTGTITLAATATDNVGVTKVAFYVDGLLKGTSITAPYGMTLDSASLGNGTHPLVAKAYDAAGNVGVSATLNFSTSGCTPLAITGDGGAVTTTAGQPATFTVVATGSNLSYQWYTGGTLISGATSATYVRTTSLSDNGTSYWVNVSNACGSLRSTYYYLTVNPAGGLSLSPTSAVVPAGQAQSLTATFGASDARLAWSCDGGTLSATSTTQSPATVAWTAPAGIVGTFTITATSLQDPTKTAQARFTVTLAGPQIVSFSADATTLTPGQSTTLRWTTQGTVGGLRLFAGAADTLGLDVTGTSALSVTPTQTTDYTLQATNLGGGATKVLRIAVGATSSGGLVWKRDMVYMGTKEVAEIDKDGTNLTLDDHLGTPRVVIKGDGSTLEQKFAPFGESLTDVATMAKFGKGFTNHEQTDPSGLIYMQARFYAPMYHRFMSPDPARDQHFEETQSWNIYSYVQNTPAMHLDPNGLSLLGSLKSAGSWVKDKVASAKTNAVRLWDKVYNGKERTFGAHHEVDKDNGANVKALYVTPAIGLKKTGISIGAFKEDGAKLAGSEKSAVHLSFGMFNADVHGGLGGAAAKASIVSATVDWKIELPGGVSLMPNVGADVGVGLKAEATDTGGFKFQGTALLSLGIQVEGLPKWLDKLNPVKKAKENLTKKYEKKFDVVVQ